MDLRTRACTPYPAVENQGSEVSCVARAFCMLLYCLKTGAGLAELPATGLPYPHVDAVFRHALDVSHDRSRGISFAGAARALQTLHAADLAALGLRLVALPNDPAALRRSLARGYPVAAGYQVNAAIAAFHQDAAHCAARGFVLPRYAPPALSAHAVLIVGYDDKVRCFLARNSWGGSWGVEGHFLIAYEDLNNVDFFTDLAFVA